MSLREMSQRKMKSLEETSHSREAQRAFNKRKSLKQRRLSQSIDVPPLKTKRKLFNGIQLDLNGRKRQHTIDLDDSACQKPLTERQQLAYLLEMTAREYQDEQCNAQSAANKCQDNADAPVERKYHHAKSAKTLKLSHGRLNKRNERGETALHLYAIKGDFEGIQSQLKQGADVDARDYADWTPLHEACNHGHYKIVKKLLKAGACVNVQGLDNDTPMHDACSNGHFKVVEVLMKYGADPFIKNKHGETPFDIASTDEIYDFLCSSIEKSSEKSVSPRAQPSDSSQQLTACKSPEISSTEELPTDNPVVDSTVDHPFVDSEGTASLVTSSSTSLDSIEQTTTSSTLDSIEQNTTSSTLDSIKQNTTSSTSLDSTEQKENTSSCTAIGDIIHREQESLVSSQCSTLDSPVSSTSSIDSRLSTVENHLADSSGIEQARDCQPSSVDKDSTEASATGTSLLEDSGYLDLSFRSDATEQCFPSSSTAVECSDELVGNISEDSQERFTSQLPSGSTSSPAHRRTHRDCMDPDEQSSNNSRSPRLDLSSKSLDDATLHECLSKSTDHGRDGSYSPNDSGYHEDSDGLITSLEHSDIRRIEESPLGKMLLHDPNFSAESSPVDNVTQCLSSCEDSSQSGDVLLKENEHPTLSLTCHDAPTPSVSKSHLDGDNDVAHIERIHRSPSSDKLRIVDLEPCDIVRSVLDSDTMDGHPEEERALPMTSATYSNGQEQAEEETLSSKTIGEDTSKKETARALLRPSSPVNASWRKAVRRDCLLNHSSTPRHCKTWMLMTKKYKLVESPSDNKGNATATPSSVDDLVKRQQLELEKLQISLEQELVRVEVRCASVKRQKSSISACTCVSYQGKESFRKLSFGENKDKSNPVPNAKKLRLAWIQDIIDKYSKLEDLARQRHRNELTATLANERLNQNCMTSRKEKIRQMLLQSSSLS